jgi:hypothetical protein
VYAQVCQIVDEWLITLKSDGRQLPPPTDGQGIAQRIA